MSLEPPPDQDIVIIGATGDLARRKLLPALYNLFTPSQLLPKRGNIVGYARRRIDTAEFRAMAKEAVREFSRTELDEKAWAAFEQRLTFVCAEPDGYPGLLPELQQPERLVYLATPPSTFRSVAVELGECGLAKGTKLVVEKPFGRDLASGRELDETLHDVFEESQIFRIDHYLGKETVQDILIFRFGNALFERVWNRDAIDHVQFTVAESIGIEGRGAFYEETGALRDIIQNHVFQVLALLTMEPPTSFDAEAIREEKHKLFQAMQPVDPSRVVRGQYTAGKIAGNSVPGYREEPGVSQDSTAETFAAMELCIDNWRWAGVPFYLRTGKRLPERATEINIWFRDVPIHLFEGTGVDALPSNHLTLSMQPNEEITFTFLAKEPGPEIRVRPVEMSFSYGATFTQEPAEAYERLLHDAMDGDHTLFARGDSVERAWQVVQPVLDAMPPVHLYPAGTWGPSEADALIAPDSWHIHSL
ncbi:MAG: glucose-6-phosphate dehydrogenase [Chloroflexi bacterium]|nr:glucose-6-phosphate dehydrogenase [Chloroflexota bacterium]